MDVNDAYEMRKKALLEMVKRDEEKKAAEKERMESFYREQAERSAAMEAEHKRMVEAFFKSHEKRSAKDQASGAGRLTGNQSPGWRRWPGEILNQTGDLEMSTNNDPNVIDFEKFKQKVKECLSQPLNDSWPKLIHEVAAKLGREPNVSMVQRLCAEFFLGFINLEEGHKPSLDDVHEADYLAQCFHEGKFAEDEALGLMVVSYLVGRLHGDLKRD